MTNHFDTEEERELVNRAKQLLMNKFQISEPEAYYQIRQSAMDNKLRKSEIAKAILEQNGVNV